MAALTVYDATLTGKRLDSMVLPDVPTRITARELIRLRVREEVARHNAALPPVFQGLVRPTEAEIVRNGYRLREPRRLDWERQADAACAAFLRNGFVLLVGERQVAELDEVLDLDGAAEVAFVKLVALVGG
ncbi:hypothetical protein Val02_06710 [Virgisporangium aliadipatigenens]|uniref:Uncharacterized protein n=1 Tax=Virgisporangium aliadipatigenens TaxID=741659 RepID=A0A8J3YGW6_9ACTN|nr:hypothetical protein [Virgisporangium aliadipatigenens]GIJ43785.1 hypothetical protein Val02_06710 [Virgisporangium aliadipatigenens]